jgi:dihydrofolate synthase/folylpolyglutamate synthase
MGARAYDAAVDALRRALVFGINPSLDGIRQLTDVLGRPQDAFASVQITGTNGKTSTARLTEALLRAEGVRTGLYTSPHLESYPERIEFDGRAISDEEFGLAVQAALNAAESIRPHSLGDPGGFTEFELLTAAALWHFAHSGVEMAVLEVGMGGRWDATSVVDPVIAAITGVGLDHIGVLGDSVEQIAAEKAGIIKRGSAVVLGPGTAGVEDVFTRKAQSLGAPLLAVRESGSLSPVAEESTARFALVERPREPGGRTTVDVASARGAYEALAVVGPSYQAANIATATATAESALGRALDEQTARAALLGVVLPARFELVRSEPPVIVDGSHNPQAAAALAGAIAQAWPEGSHRPNLLLGILADKDAEGIVRALTRVTARLSVCTPDSERALAAADLAAVVERVTGRQPSSYASVAEAIAELLGSSPDGLVISGSLVTAGTARHVMRELDGKEAAERR